jgi:hypothetical protein
MTRDRVEGAIGFALLVWLVLAPLWLPAVWQ